MRYQVIPEPGVEEEIEQAFLYISQQSPLNAIRWYNGCLETIYSLADFPQRCALAPEAGTFHYEIRQLLYGNYRILFTIRGSTVHILHVRHAARRTMTPDDTTESAE